ncbi:hypothetical protein J4407_00015 [Candidatus Pacearchaeota archaeon]|nr:hypothetical protein [Candidatus Pacearchaeota archaeon]
MGNNLEQKLEKVDWKEWIPFLGIYYSSYDANGSKPTILNNGTKLQKAIWSTYQSSSVTGFAYLLYEHLFNRIP